MSIKITGLKEIGRKLDDLSRRAEEIDGTNEVPINDLFSTLFISRCSKYSSAEEMFEASGYKIETQEDFDAIPDKEWDEFIKNNTEYASWEEMLQAASAEWVKKKIGL
jgi:hypothetical protein